MAEAETSPPLFFPNPPTESTAEEEEVSTPEKEFKTTARTGRGFNPNKPPAIRGYKWSPNKVGFDCKRFTEVDGRTVEVWIGYLGKKKLAELRAQSEDKDELRQLIKAWIAEKEAAKGKSFARVSNVEQKQNHREKRGDL